MYKYTILSGDSLLRKPVGTSDTAIGQAQYVDFQ